MTARGIDFIQTGDKSRGIMRPKMHGAVCLDICPLCGTAVPEGETCDHAVLVQQDQPSMRSEEK